jgi:hypothetical protein
VSQKTHRKAIAKLEALYATIPRVACRGRCAIARGAVPMTTLEAARARRADPGRRLPMIREDARCIYLTARERCSVYAVRPLVCRVWGAVQRMSCMHGCVPDRWLTDRESLALMQAVERVGGAMVLPTLGPLAPHDSFLDFRPESQWLPDAVIEQMAARTRGLRALHGGRIIGCTPSNTPNWIDLDKERAAGR